MQLDGDAVLLWRDTVVLGRAGEAPGRMVAELDVHRGGSELHAEQLDTGDLELLFSPVVLGAGARVPRHAGALRRPCGARADQGTLQLAGPGTIRPLPAPTLATAARTLDPLQARWRAELFCDDDQPRRRNDR